MNRAAQGSWANEIEGLKALVEEHLFDYLPDAGEGPVALNEAMRYTLGLPGKRIRPVLLLLAYKAVRLRQADVSQAMPYACAIEYIHNYSLIHDDLPAMDDDDLRRGKPTNHKVFGEAVAILAGDGLLSAAFGAMFDDCLEHVDGPDGRGGPDPVPLAYRIAAGAAIAEACGCRGMVAGQAADIYAEGKDISAGQLDYIHINKTAALLRASVTAGALLGGARGGQLDALSEYGECLGLAFQIADDLLDKESETEVIGKTAGKDEKAGKATYPAVHGISASRARLKELTLRAEGAAGRAVTEATETSGAAEASGAAGAAETSGAAEASGAAALDGGMNTFYVEILQEFARGLAERVK
ncbi:MAG: polyprenyl synthetase family protein [Clostridiales bacterium]|nr:polyprenyl synthetase family protein [Clostridiales bacterium]